MIGEASVTDRHYGEPLSCSLRSLRSLGSSRSFLEPRRSLRRSRGPRRPPPRSVPPSGRRRLPRRRLRRSTPIASSAAVAADPSNTRGGGASLEWGAAASLASTWSLFVVFQQREGGDISSVRPFGRAEVVDALAGQVAVVVVALVMAENEKRGEAALSNETTEGGDGERLLSFGRCDTKQKDKQLLSRRPRSRWRRRRRVR